MKHFRLLLTSPLVRRLQELGSRKSWAELCVPLLIGVSGCAFVLLGFHPRDSDALSSIGPRTETFGTVEKVDSGSPSQRLPYRITTRKGSIPLNCESPPAINRCLDKYFRYGHAIRNVSVTYVNARSRYDATPAAVILEARNSTSVLLNEQQQLRAWSHSQVLWDRRKNEYRRIPSSIGQALIDGFCVLVLAVFAFGYLALAFGKLTFISTSRAKR